jgi:4-amino-4-deoxy-L-arabinose transferase-like glycosyltransferase
MNRSNQAAPAKKKPVVPQGPSVREKLEQWCQSHRPWIILTIIAVSLALRVVYYQQCSNTGFINEHLNPESDMSFFNEGAVKIADGDLLSKTIHHPQHKWMEWVANRYFQSHPDKLELLKTKIGNDTLNNSPTKMIWNQWYGENTFQQEPLYSYFIAMNYTLFGKNVRWVFILQMLLGILTNLLVYLVTRRYFGELAGTVAGFLAVFCGPMLFYEMVLLRSSMAVFIGALLIWLTGTAVQKNKFAWWLITGIAAGLALLVHAFYMFFMFFMILILLILYRKTLAKGVSYAAAITLGLCLAISPLIYRNFTVGAPPLSLSSNSAISFVTMNNESFKSFIGWNMNTTYLSEILGAADGKLFKSMILSLKTHPSVGSYLSQVWDKLHATFSWYEIPNNVNFYLYREYMPVLFLAFISFLVISPLALTGIFLSLYKKINAWPLYLMILVYLFPMLAFMVLSRYRIIFVPVLIPFAALTITELLGSWKGRENYLIMVALLVFGYWAATTGNIQVSKITKNDYAGIWSVHYANSIKDPLARQEWDKVAPALSGFLDKYEPRKISDANPSYRCDDRNESEIFDYFSMMHSNLSIVCSNNKDSARARSEGEISANLKTIASRQPRSH